MRLITMIGLAVLLVAPLPATTLQAETPGAAPPAAVGAADLAAVLTSQENQTLDVVELGTGKRFVRPVLKGVVVRDGSVVSLRLQPEGEARPTTVLLKAITKIVADRETVFEADAKGGGAAQLRGQRARAAFEKQVAESRARMQSRGVEPWPTLSSAEHAAEVEALREFVAQVREAFPKLQVTETHEFLVVTDIPPAQIGPYVATLDRMHDFLCDFYGIPKGEPVWKGKCLVVAFLDEDDFVAFEGRFMQNEARGAHGLCHQRTDGRVIMSCHRGPDAAAFGHMLVHETSHGFNFRWLSPVRLPNWLNEGVAEWVGTKVVPHCNQVPLKEARALEYLRSRGDLGPEFLTRDNIDAVQYGIASGMVTFLAREPAKFAVFVRSIKEGMPMAESLRQAYGVSVEEFVAAYGRALGVPHLRP
jgi:hypothetical protein